MILPKIYKERNDYLLGWLNEETIYNSSESFFKEGVYNNNSITVFLTIL